MSDNPAKTLLSEVLRQRDLLHDALRLDLSEPDKYSDGAYGSVVPGQVCRLYQEFVPQRGPRTTDPLYLEACRQVAAAGLPDLRGMLRELADVHNALVDDYYSAWLDRRGVNDQLLDNHCQAVGRLLRELPILEQAHGRGADLTDTERDIVEALGNETLRGPEIATRSGYDYETIRHKLPELVRRGILQKTNIGYRKSV